MIDRYSITAATEQLAKRFGVDVPDGYRARYNAAPSQLLPIVLLYSRGLSFFYWGESPQWAKNKPFSEKWINVRAEQIAERPLLQKSLKKNRCIIPADGFYAWRKTGKKTQIPYRFVLKSREIFSIPGLWEEYEDESGESFHTFTLITMPGHATLADRLPVIFDQEKEGQWMNPQATTEELIPLLASQSTDHLDFYTVSPRINSLTADDKTLIMPAPAADQFGNLTLFD